MKIAIALNKSVLHKFNCISQFRYILTDLKRSCIAKSVLITTVTTKHSLVFSCRDIERDFVIPQCKKIEEWLTGNKSETLVLECQGGILTQSRLCPRIVIQVTFLISQMLSYHFSDSREFAHDNEDEKVLVNF